jgi:hypothetical protein
LGYRSSASKLVVLRQDGVTRFASNSAGTAFAARLWASPGSYSRVSATEYNGRTAGTTAGSPDVAAPGHGFTVNTPVAFFQEGSQTISQYFVKSVTSGSFQVATTTAANAPAVVFNTTTPLAAGTLCVVSSNSQVLLDDGFHFAPPASAAPKYDQDGNLLTDGRFTYSNVFSKGGEDTQLFYRWLGARKEPILKDR